MVDVITILGLTVPWAVAIVLAIIVYVKQGKIIDIKEVAEETEKVLDEVLAFFNEEEPMSKTSLETIQTIIPANSYQMTEEDRNRILATCEDEAERTRISELITNYENPMLEGEECCVYTIETSHAIFEVHYGNPVTLMSGDGM